MKEKLEIVKSFCHFLLLNDNEMGVLFRVYALEYLRDADGISNFKTNMDCFKFGIVLSGAHYNSRILKRILTNRVDDLTDSDIKTSTKWLFFIINEASHFVEYLYHRIINSNSNDPMFTEYTINEPASYWNLNKDEREKIVKGYISKIKKILKEK